MRLGLLDLNNHFSVGEYARRVQSDTSSGRYVLRVIHADRGAGTRFNKDLVADRSEFADACWGQADTVFVVLYLLGNPNAHKWLPDAIQINAELNDALRYDCET
jgi:hypothetical protein